MTDTAKTELVNAAMAHLGEPPFESVDADPPPARLVKVLAQLDGRAGVEYWALSRRPWLCAIRYATLTPSGDVDGNWRFENAFLLPATCVGLWLVKDADLCDVTAYQQGTAEVSAQQRKVIYSDEATLNVACVEAVDYEAYSHDLLAVMAWELAARTAGPLQNATEGVVLRYQKKAREALQEAASGEFASFEDAAPVATGFATLRLTGG